MVLLVLALAWATVLFFWWRSRSQDTFGDSVGLFHRHLHVLERTAPGQFKAANRLRVPDPTFGSPRRQAVGIGTGLPRAVAPRGAVAPGSSAQLLAQTRRRQSRRRRRDVLTALVIVTGVTLLVAGITRSVATITLQIATDLALFGYVALLVQLRNMAAEREAKVRYMHPQARLPRPVAQMAPGMAPAMPAPVALSARMVTPSAAEAFYTARAAVGDAYTYVADEDPSAGYGYIEPERYQPERYEAERYQPERYEAAYGQSYEADPSYGYEPYELDTAQYAAAGY